MSSRSLNKVILIGNLTRDPELRFTPSGAGVCTFGLATNRSWTTQTGETREETEFHRIVAWNKLGELCSQLLSKGKKVYVEGRLATHSWTGQDGSTRSSTEVVIEDMIILDSKRVVAAGDGPAVDTVLSVSVAPAPVTPVAVETVDAKKEEKPPRQNSEQAKEDQQANETITPDDIPF